MLTEVISGQVIFFSSFEHFYLNFSKIKIDCLIRKKHFLKEKQKQNLMSAPELIPCLSNTKLRAAGTGALGWKVPRPPNPHPPPPPASPLLNITPHPGRKVASVAYKVALVDIPVSHRPCQTTHIYLPKKTKQDTVEAAIQLRYLCSLSRDNVHQFHCNSFIFLKNRLLKRARARKHTHTHTHTHISSEAWIHCSFTALKTT